MTVPWGNGNIHISFPQNLFHKTEGQKILYKNLWFSKSGKQCIVYFPFNES